MYIHGVKKLQYTEHVDTSSFKRKDALLKWHTCKSKKSYDTEKGALHVASKMAKSKGITLRAYNCPYCFKWHLTKKIRY